MQWQESNLHTYFQNVGTSGQIIRNTMTRMERWTHYRYFTISIRIPFGVTVLLHRHFNSLGTLTFEPLLLSFPLQLSLPILLYSLTAIRCKHCSSQPCFSFKFQVSYPTVFSMSTQEIDKDIPFSKDRASHFIQHPTGVLSATLHNHSLSSSNLHKCTPYMAEDSVLVFPLVQVIQSLLYPFIQ